VDFFFKRIEELRLHTEVENLTFPNPGLKAVSSNGMSWLNG
jgi:hypothetical protein